MRFGLSISVGVNINRSKHCGLLYIPSLLGMQLTFFFILTSSYKSMQQHPQLGKSGLDKSGVDAGRSCQALHAHHASISAYQHITMPAYQQGTRTKIWQDIFWLSLSMRVCKYYTVICCILYSILNSLLIAVLWTKLRIGSPWTSVHGMPWYGHLSSVTNPITLVHFSNSTCPRKLVHGQLSMSLTNVHGTPWWPWNGVSMLWTFILE